MSEKPCCTSRRAHPSFESCRQRALSAASWADFEGTTSGVALTLTMDTITQVLQTAHRQGRTRMPRGGGGWGGGGGGGGGGGVGGGGGGHGRAGGGNCLTLVYAEAAPTWRRPGWPNEARPGPLAGHGPYVHEEYVAAGGGRAANPAGGNGGGGRRGGGAVDKPAGTFSPQPRGGWAHPPPTAPPAI